MSKKIIKYLSTVLLLFTVFTFAVGNAYDIIIPDSVVCSSGIELKSYPLLSAYSDGIEAQKAENSLTAKVSSDVNYKLYGIIPLKTVKVTGETPLMVFPGGMPFGVKFMTDGILVVGFCQVDTKSGNKNPAESSGLRANDVIIKMNGSPITSSDELTSAVEASGGKDIELTYRRDGKEYTTKLSPAFSETENKYKTGLYVRDSGAGIGTVTFVIPESYAFAGLGHGICDGQTGKLIPMQRGSVVGVTINGVVRGLAGSPGEVKGYFSSGKTGSLLGNTECGVYGVFASKPQGIHADPLPVGSRSDVKEGKAHIYCTLDTNGVSKYEIEISAINKDSTSNKCFCVKITDPALLEKTGGIIQGMSGSPIIQNGKLVGAVTHVLINDPTTGYGIFIENMLNQMGELAK
ncbi:MAG: SpoIVB peptidase [Ruminococcaceae bacterium]|nr:SpoIVB peptidase [Oscillospiraceae bacterium]